jgi:DNA-binding NtrC family response regulator
MNYKNLDMAPNSRVETEANIKLHIEALRELAQAFVKEVEDLGGDRQAQSTTDDLTFYDEVRRFEINLICRALIRAGGQQNRAARLLGVKTTTLNSKIKRYRIDWNTPRGINATLQTIDSSMSGFGNNSGLQGQLQQSASPNQG